MSGISLQFGPEWMRSKQTSTPSSTLRPSPHTMSSPVAVQTPTSSLYSSFVTNNILEQDKDSSGNPFKYSKEEMLQVWTEGGGRGALGVEIELWDGVVKELGRDPIGIKELSELEKKLFAASLNSEVRRRQSHDILPNSLERPKLSLSSSTTQTSFGQSRFSPLLARRKKDEFADPNVSALRRLSLSGPLSPAPGPMSPSGGLPSPRVKVGPNSPAYDSIIGDINWRKKDERRADTLGEPQASTDLNSPAENGKQAQGFHTHHIISATATENITEDVEVGNRVLTQAQVALDSVPPLETVLDNRLKLHDHRSLVSNNNDGLSETRPPGFNSDPEKIAWVYRDPKGNVQGPFSANLMQKWYDEGYFAPDLLVKRSHIDNEWIMVGELAMHARNGKLFLQLYPEYSPQGSFSQSNLPPSPQPFARFPHLPAQPEGHAVDYLAQQSMFQQHGGSNYIGVSDSYHNISSLLVQSPSNTSILDIPSSPELLLKQATSNRASVLQPILDKSASFEQTTAPRNGISGRLDHPEFMHPALMGQYQTFPSSQESSGGSVESPWNLQSIDPRDEALGNIPLMKFASNPTSYGLPNIDDIYDLPSSSSASHVPLSNREKEELFTGQNQTKLLPTDDDLNRSLVFIPDPAIASRQNTNGHNMGGLPSTPLNQYGPPNSQLYSSSENPQDGHSLSSLATEEIPTAKTLAENVVSTDFLRTCGEVPKPTQSWFPSSKQTGISAERTGKKTEYLDQNSVTSHAIPEKEQHSESVASASIPPATPSTARSKSAWKNPIPVVDDIKLGLREIQEAESRKIENHKPARPEKERITRSNNVPIDDLPISPTTWGLPVSQAGNSRPVPKESFPVSSQPAPGWAGKSGPIKQSMKEIQEEEELKKKTLAKEKEVVQNKRAYAESANKGNAQAGAGVWTTVGAGGRHNVLGPPNMATHPATRQTSITTATTTLQSIVSAKPTINRLPGSNAFSSVKAPSRSISSSADDTPIPPSPEFIKWLRDSLRGFNPGFNTEEFMTMLLAFPLDFPSSTVEVIQDMVYMNSVTMDGRRFAAEFCSKRRSDAANRPRNVNGRQPSLAEVVKSQPKPVQSELPFKVVKKKGKGNSAR